MRTLLADYKKSVDAIAEAFLNKQNEDGEPPVRISEDRDIWWTSINDAGGTLCVGGETFYGLDDMITDLVEDAPVGELDRYNEWCSRCAALGLERLCNYRSWLHGCPRYSDETLKHLEGLRQQFFDEVEALDGKKF